MGTKSIGVTIGTVIIVQFVCIVQCFDFDLLNKQASYLDAKVGTHAVFNCPLDFPQDIEIPYILHWNKEVNSIFKFLHITFDFLFAFLIIID